MEDQTLKEIESDYLKAWYVRNNAYSSIDSYGIADYYTDSMRIKIERILKLNKDHNTTIRQTTLAHHPSLNFYSTDGTMVVFTDHHVEYYQEVWHDDQLVLKKRDTNSYKVLMLLEDGFWRIRHLTEIKDSKEFSHDKNEEVAIKFDVAQIKGLNYYPSQSAWDKFGQDFNEEIIADDFAQIRKMGLNTLRIFIPYEGFGKASISAGNLAKLKIMLDQAENNGLKILVTLFDFYGNYELTDWTVTHRHAETLVKRL